MRASYAATFGLVFGLVTTAANAQDAGSWAGMYGGLSYTTGNAHQVYDSGPSYDLDGQGLGLMIGYNYATGPWVIGGELAYNKAKIGETPAGIEDLTFTSFLDIKARAGYAVNQFLVYGTIGATFSVWKEEVDEGNFNGDGLSYGVGVDYLVSPRVFVGAEYLVRDVTSDWNISGGTFDADVETLTLRVGMKF
jgi:outer membrane immunogenic protein